MNDIPKRDVTGECEGECKDQVTEQQKEQQKKLDAEGMEHSTAETPQWKTPRVVTMRRVTWAGMCNSRSNSGRYPL